MAAPRVTLDPPHVPAVVGSLAPHEIGGGNWAGDDAIHGVEDNWRPLSRSLTRPVVSGLRSTHIGNCA
jgi:hypothetical protein